MNLYLLLDDVGKFFSEVNVRFQETIQELLYRTETKLLGSKDLDVNSLLEMTKKRIL